VWILVTSPGATPKRLTIGTEEDARFDDALWEQFGIWRSAKLQISPDGSRLVSYCGSGPIKVWDVATGAMLLQTPVNNYAGRIMFTCDGARCIVVAESPYETDRFNHREYVYYSTGIDLRNEAFDFVEQPLPRGGELMSLSSDGRRGVVAVWERLFEIDLGTQQQLT
jgi:hypothetical protein